MSGASSLVVPQEQAIEELNDTQLGAVYQGEELPSNWELQKLSPKHMQVAALVAQGMKFVDVSALVNYTPQYISMLMRQPLMKAYVQKMSEAAGTRLEALFEKSVEVIADTLENGSEKGKLSAARLQLEATKRLGRADSLTIIPGDPDARLAQLRDRLVDLFNSGGSELYNEDGSPRELKFIEGKTLPAEPT